MAESLSAMSDEQLVERLRARERELVTARFTHSTNQLENTASIRVIRKDVARLRTEARARELKNGARKDSLVGGAKSAKAASAAPTVPVTAPEKGGFLKGIVDKLTAKE